MARTISHTPGLRYYRDLFDSGQNSKDEAQKQTASVAAPVATAPVASSGYTSPYATQLNTALNKITNWNYDPLADANYQALAKIYGARGNIAAKDTLGDAAALNGGYGTSYAVSAAQQARNQYNQELAALIPDLENAAYNKASGALSALRGADDTNYGRYRDDISDSQWQQQFDYQKQQDAIANARAEQQQAFENAQWLMEWNAAQKASKKSSAGGSGGSSRKSGGGGGYTSGDSESYLKRLYGEGTPSAVVQGSIGGETTKARAEVLDLRKKNKSK